MNHEEHCKHDLAHCEHCDAAYCRKCKKEWGVPCNLNHYPVVIGGPIYPTPTWGPYWSPWGTTTIAVGSTCDDIGTFTTNAIGGAFTNTGASS